MVAFRKEDWGEAVSPPGGRWRVSKLDGSEQLNCFLEEVVTWGVWYGRVVCCTCPVVIPSEGGSCVRKAFKPLFVRTLGEHIVKAYCCSLNRNHIDSEI